MNPQLLLHRRNSVIPLEDIHLLPENRQKLYDFIEEYSFEAIISRYGLSVGHKLLLSGASGCGKTTTAHAVAQRLEKKIMTLNLSELVSSKLGETGKNLTDFIRKASLEQAVLFIDEFDFIGKTRDYQQNDSGEIRRLVNVVLQQMDHLPTQTLLIAATNFPQALDTALLRRFELHLTYEMPTQLQLQRYYTDLLSRFPESVCQDISLLYGVSYAQARDSVLQQIKRNIIRKEKQNQHNN